MRLLQRHFVRRAGTVGLIRPVGLFQPISLACLAGQFPARRQNRFGHPAYADTRATGENTNANNTGQINQNQPMQAAFGNEGRLFLPTDLI